MRDKSFINTTNMIEDGIWVNKTGVTLYAYWEKKTLLSDGNGIITISITSGGEFSGSSKSAPTSVVTYNGTTLTEGVDYTIVYILNGNVVSSLTNAGIYKVTAKGLGSYYNNINYYGSISADYSIDPRAINDCTVASIPDQFYTGSEIKPTITITDEGLSYTLINGTDFNLVYSNNINAGNALIQINGIGNYYKTRGATFKIVTDGNNVRTIVFYKTKDDLSVFQKNVGETYSMIDTPVKEGYSFVGWSSSINNVATWTDGQKACTESASWYAVWSKDYRITYNYLDSNLNRLSVQSDLVTLNYEYSSTDDFVIFEIPIIQVNQITSSSDVFSFNGYAINPTENSGAYANSNDISSKNTTIEVHGLISLYATYKADILVTYYANGGTNPPSAQTSIAFINTGDETINLSPATIKLTSSIPQKVDDAFVGWSTDANATNSTYSSGSSYSI
jgi:hypothetical protein